MWRMRDVIRSFRSIPPCCAVPCSQRIWQKKWGKTAEGSIEIDPSDMEGTYGQSPSGQGGTRTIPGTTKLTMDTPLYVFGKNRTLRVIVP